MVGIGAAILLLAIVSFFKTTTSTTRAEPKLAQPGDAATNSKSKEEANANAKPVDLKEQILNDARKTAREDYITTMREEFRNNGVDASISDHNGELAIVSDLLKLKPDRDEILRRQFGPAVRRNLCTMGFKSLSLRSGVIFGDGDEYSLGCPETNAEKESRLQEQRSARQKFVDDLQRTFDSDPQGHGMQIAQANNEILFTADFGDLSPQMIRAMWLSKFSDQEKKNLCGIGFKGIRARADAKSPGTFISFGCGSAASK
ncbi:MAG: hypothetical protein ABSB88_10855 [Bryobacteraceae bacterium]|jgi:uncharacterized protein YnzC (UPF0291/DUF896 family)